MTQTRLIITLSSLISVSLLLSTVTSAFAADKYSLTSTDFRSSVCNVESMTVEFRIEIAFNEPLIRSKSKWTAGPNTHNDCFGDQTFVYLEAARRDGPNIFIKINPKIIEANNSFGPTSAVSRGWAILMCNSTDDSASCLSEIEAKNAYDLGLNFETFHVRSRASVAKRQLTQGTAAPQTNVNTTSAYDQFLTDMEQGDSSSHSIQKIPTKITLTPTGNDGQKPQTMTTNPRVLAKEAADRVITLLSSSLAQYTTPSNECESARQVSNRVRLLSTCQINFNRESKHDFLCAEKNEPTEIANDIEVTVDFSRHIALVNELRYSDEGWVSLVLRLNDNIVQTDNKIKLDRWEFVGANHTSDQMESLASSLSTLKNYCESSS